MKKPLIIVESPTKARTIKKFLPPRYVVKASVGHVRDLPKSTLGVDVEHDFTPKYLTIKGKGDIIKELKSAVKGASEVYLATDPDREGEAIAWHLAELLKLQDPKRIELHEITKDAALAAIKSPHSDRHGSRECAAGAAHPRSPGRLQNLAATVGQGPRRALGRPRAVGRGTADRRSRTGDQRVQPARILDAHRALATHRDAEIVFPADLVARTARN